MKVGVARTSTLEQKAGLDAQIRELQEAGCEKIFQEQTSSVGKREQLEAALDFVRHGDVLVVSKLDRLARSVIHLGQIIKRLDDRGVNLQILDLNIDTSQATGKLMLNIMGSVAQFERECMLERQREGIAAAKTAGKYKGRKPTARAKTDDVLNLSKQNIGPSEIARRVGISRSSVYRILEE